MKTSHPKAIFRSQAHTQPRNRTRPTARPLLRQNKGLLSTAHKGKHAKELQEKQRTREKDLSDGLAICLFGFSVQAQTHNVRLNVSPVSTPVQDEKQVQKQKSVANTIELSVPKPTDQPPMYDVAYGEEVRQQAVMAEVLPDAECWRQWEKTEAVLRKGRGWYPRLDRHFLELLVISEIHCLSHPLHSSPPGTAERIHRHASRVRRVACERIGSERLHAYCERVKEAFEAYMMGGWSQRGVEVEHDEGLLDEELEREERELEEEEERERGRQLERGDGSVKRESAPIAQPDPAASTLHPNTTENPFSDAEEDQSHLLEIDLKDVQLDEVREVDSETDDSGDDASSARATVGSRGMDVDQTTAATTWGKRSDMDVDVPSERFAEFGVKHGHSNHNTLESRSNVRLAVEA